MQRSVLALTFAASAALALAACGGGSNNSSSASATASAAAAAASPAQMSKAAPQGAAVYNANCSSCHQANGKGSPGAFPPLAGNSTVTGPAAKVIHIVKNGLTGAVTVNGQTYNGMMPAWKSHLSDAEIAAVITYVRSSFGNKAPAVTTAQVTATK